VALAPPRGGGQCAKEDDQMSYELWTQIGETITQIIAFLIFVWAMKKFVWPILAAVLDERQRKIEEGFADIERRQQEAQAALDEYRQRLEGIEQEARQKIQEAIAEGRRVAAELTENAREEARQITERAQRNIELQIGQARLELRDEVVQLVMDASERLLREKLDEQTDQRLVAAFIDDLERQRA